MIGGFIMVNLKYQLWQILTHHSWLVHLTEIVAQRPTGEMSLSRQANSLTCDLCFAEMGAVDQPKSWVYGGFMMFYGGFMMGL